MGFCTENGLLHGKWASARKMGFCTRVGSRAALRASGSPGRASSQASTQREGGWEALCEGDALHPRSLCRVAHREPTRVHYERGKLMSGTKNGLEGGLDGAGEGERPRRTEVEGEGGLARHAAAREVDARPADPRR